MAYKHDVFQEAWKTVKASYPALLNQHEAATDLIHETIKKLGRKKKSDNQMLKIINQSMHELGITQNKQAFRVFAGTYHGIVSQIIQHGRHSRAAKKLNMQGTLPLH